MSLHIGHLGDWFALALLGVALSARGQDQTYKVGPESSQPASPQSTKQKSGTRSATPPTGKELGWGSNIQTARLARAAESALKSNNYSAAVDYAQRAVNTAPNDPKLWFLLGYASRLAGKSQVSMDAYNHGLSLDPSSLEGLSGLAQTYSRMGRRDEAESLLKRVLAADPRRTNDLLVLGEMYLQAGQYDQAIPPLQHAEELQSGARPELLLALAHQRLGQFSEAKRYLELAKRRSPNNAEVLRSIAGFYRETGNYAAAISALKSIRAPGPDIKAELAYTYQLSGRPDEAANFYSQAADAAPHDLNLQLSAAQAHLSENNLEGAQTYLNRAAALDANHYRLHAIRGEVARLEERDEDAVREYNAALSSLPQAPPEGPLYGIQLQMNLVQLYQRMHDQPSANQHLAVAQSEIGKLNIAGSGREEFLRVRALVKLFSGDTDSALKDVKEALALNPKDINALQLNGDLLDKMGHGEEAIEAFKKVLAVDPDNQLALTSLGSVSRELKRDPEAEKYFQRLASTHPRLYVPHLALGDMYTGHREFAKAETEYRKAHALAPKNSLVVAGGMNAAIEAHKLPLAARWLSRASAAMQQDPYVMREKERYLLWTQKYQESADAGEHAIKKLPRDRDVVVYLGYDLLHLHRYDELLQLTNHYEDILPKEPDLPLLAGYVYKSNEDLENARAAFTRAIDRDPKIATAYVNRGFVLHDQRQSAAAAADFQTALRLDPKDGEAHLGMAYTSLDMHRPRAALEHAKFAEKSLGDSMSLHLIRGTAYGEEGMLHKSAAEYRIALKSAPKDPKLHEALANTLYELHDYQEAIGELQIVQQLSPNDGLVDAQLARSYAKLGDHDQTVRYVQLAEQQGSSAIYVVTGEALSTLGEEDAAMDRFERALTAPDTDRMNVRLAVARMMLNKGETADARRQITLALMEVAAGRSGPPTGSQLLEAADLFLGMHEYQLAETYFERALAAGASESSVRVGLANTYLALGDTPRAAAQLEAVSNSLTDEEPNYQYLLAKANLYRQRRQNAQALTAFALASEAAGEDPSAEREMLRTGADEGVRINRRLSLLSDASVAPVFEDTTVYALDAQLVNATPGALPLPRSSLETQWTTAYHLHMPDLPDASGFFQIRNARGAISLPSANLIVNRDTWDYSFNFALNPTLHLGNNVLAFSGGIQRTIRRDNADPYDMNQNLFRQFLYLNTSSFFNWVSVSGYAIHEAGPFTLNQQSSRDLAGALDFRVGRPWGKTAFVTGWGARDEQYSPYPREFYYTSTYAGIEERLSDRFSFRALGEYLRTWRVEGRAFAIAQAFRPAASFEFSPTRNWTIQASGAFSRNMGFHAYDAVQSGFAVSYALPVGRKYEENGRSVNLRYPIRFSAGMQQETFFNFIGAGNHQFRPYLQVNIF